MKSGPKNKEDHSPALLPGSALSLDDEQFRRLADVPPEIEWFANLTNPNTRRAYRSDLGSFMRFLGIVQPTELRRDTRAHVLAWRKQISSAAPATVRRKLAAVSSLFDYCANGTPSPAIPLPA